MSRIPKVRKAVLVEKLAAAAAAIPVMGLKLVRISHAPGDTFFHYVCDDEDGTRHYLEIALKERI